MITKEEIREALVQNLTKSGKKLTASTETLDSLIEALYDSKVQEETTVESFVSDNLVLFEKVEGNVRKDVSIELKKAEELSNKDKAKGGVKPLTTDPAKPDDPNAAMLEMIRSLKETVDTMASDKTVTEKKSQLKTMLIGKGIKNDKFIDAYIKNITLNVDSDLDSVTEQGLALYNSVTASDIGDGATPNRASKSDGKDDYADVISEFKNEE